MNLGRQVLLDAALLLEECGWTQGFEGMAPEGPCCVAGAICRTTGVIPGPPHNNSSDHEDAVALIREWIQAHYPSVEYTTWDNLGSNQFVSLAVWNDRKCRTADEVISALRSAATV